MYIKHIYITHSNFTNSIPNFLNYHKNLQSLSALCPKKVYQRVQWKFLGDHSQGHWKRHSKLINAFPSFSHQFFNCFAAFNASEPSLEPVENDVSFIISCRAFNISDKVEKDSDVDTTIMWVGINTAVGAVSNGTSGATRTDGDNWCAMRPFPIPVTSLYDLWVNEPCYVACIPIVSLDLHVYASTQPRYIVHVICM